MTTAALGGVDEVAHSDDLDASLGEFQLRLSMIFGRARAQWKESAARVHPDLQPAGYKLLACIARSDRANAHQLAELFEMDKSVISRQVRALEDWGLIVSRPDDRDARQRVLTATPAAQAALADVRVEYAARLREVLAHLAPEELDAAGKVFRCLSEM
ncbi:MAG: MarR family transcriptional regulator [Microbacterium sp.]|uniref:MarR family winged helix-turn-helix transcriptional regulator n=1 Tax=Microbacterium sp. TaxID=51671 RepID=UPI001ACD9F44|nr:MarR family transcriptional regulator [Microbacterium sp.]MBN9176642.1 MarR family transcriptional regulator [Microbacterium sp.]